MMLCHCYFAFGLSLRRQFRRHSFHIFSDYSAFSSPAAIFIFSAFISCRARHIIFGFLPPLPAEPFFRSWLFSFAISIACQAAATAY